MLVAATAATAQLPAFPGAEGFGAYAVGGRYGDVYHVTTLSGSASTPGSLAYGLANAPANGRTIVFDISGHIPVNGSLTAGKPRITIAGQTAPGDGVGITNGTFWISAGDLVIRHFRFRNGKSADCVDITSAATNTILDHCDLLFSTDENFSSFGSPPENLTFQWSANAWGLYPHSAGGLWDQNHATAHHTLWAHNHTRDPKAHPNGLLDWINNVTYDYGIGFIMGDSTATADWKANVEGCYFICPPSNLREYVLSRASLDTSGNPNFSLFLTNCLFDRDGDLTLDGRAVVSGDVWGDYRKLTSAVPRTAGVPVTQDPPLLAYKKIVSAVGPLRLDASHPGGLRDEVDVELIHSLTALRRDSFSHASDSGAPNGGFGTLNTAPAPPDTDRDGLPDFWEAALGSNFAADDHTNQVPAGAFVPHSPAGYTLLEEYLQFRAMPHAVVAKSVTGNPSAFDADLRRYTGGFTNRLPVTFTVSNVSTGAVTLTGGYVAHVEPPTNYVGRASFRFGVTDGDGSAWTQTFAILVSAAPLPRDLIWKGDGAANAWNTNAPNWIRSTSVTAFVDGDNATFDDSGSSSPAVKLEGVLSPQSLTVAAAGDYTFGGAGLLAGAMALAKSGAGILTISNANSYTGGTVVSDSTLVLAPGASVGSGAVTLRGGTLSSLYGATSDFVLSGGVVVPDGEAGTVNLSPRMALGGLAGGGTLNLTVSGSPFNYDRLNGSHAAFTGTVIVSGTLAGAVLTLNYNGGAFDGNLGNAAVMLDQVTILGRHNSGGNALLLGALSGTASARLGGSGYAGDERIVVGGLGLSTVFAGNISNGVAVTSVDKVGAGILTLGGTSAYTGATSVSGGALRVTGRLENTPVTLGANTTLSGDGFLGGGVTAQAGATLSPGPGDDRAGTMTVSNGLTLAAPILRFDLSGSPAGTNDRIQMLGGKLTMSGIQDHRFNLTDGALGAGTYALIEGATNSTAWAGATHNLPAGTRQSFSLIRPAAGSNPSYTRLVVSGSAASLLWQGGNGSVWDRGVTTNWLNGGSPDVFMALDAVTFNDASTNGAVTLSGPLLPRSVTVSNAARAYTLGGGGDLAGGAVLTKAGTNTLTITPTRLSLVSITTSNSPTVIVTNPPALVAGLSVSGSGIPAGAAVAAVVDGTTITLTTNATLTATNTLTYVAVNTYTGGTILAGGTLALGNKNANEGGLGGSPVTFGGGTLKLYGYGLSDDIAGYGTFDNPLEVPTGVTATLLTPPRFTLASPLTGSGTLNLHVNYVRGDVTGDWSAFAGRIVVLNTPSGTDDLRVVNTNGFPLARLRLTSNVWMYSRASREAEIPVGELVADVGARLTSGSYPVTWRVGGLHTDATNAALVEGTVSFVKEGAGSWTITGANTYLGDTVVAGGSLFVHNPVGSGTGVGEVDVWAGATLGGTGTIGGPVTIEGGGTLSPGPSVGRLAISNSLTLMADSVARIEVNKAAGTADHVLCAGLVSFDGILDITNTAGVLVPGDAFPIFVAAGHEGDVQSIRGSPGRQMVWRFDPTRGLLRVESLLPPGQSQFQAAIAFTNYNRPEPLTNFPALMMLGPNISGFDYNTFLDPAGGDLRFTTGDGMTALNYEIDTWNPAGASTVWVQVPRLTNQATILVSWGRAGVTNPPACTTNGAAWSEGFLGVWHLRETNGAHRDSSPRRATSRVVVATQQGTAVGICGAADRFDGVDDYVSLPDMGTTTAVTVECWASPSATPGGSEIGLVSSDPWAAGFAHFKVSSAMSVKAALYGGAVLSSAGGAFVVGDWFHAAYAVAGTASNGFSLYLNGGLVSNAAGMAAHNLTDLNIAREYSGRYFNARMDEIRISSVARSSNWLWAVHRSLASNGWFTSYGPVTTAAPNTAPSLAAVSNRVVGAGRWLIVTNVASDPDAPAQALTFALAQAPSNATVEATNGIFRWRPGVLQAGTNHLVALAVTDDGVPPLGATQQFVVTVPPLGPASLSSISVSNGVFAFRIEGDAGLDYYLEGSTNFASWYGLATTNAATPPLTWLIPVAPAPPRQFFRTRLGP